MTSKTKAIMDGMEQDKEVNSFTQEQMREWDRIHRYSEMIKNGKAYVTKKNGIRYLHIRGSQKKE